MPKKRNNNSKNLGNRALDAELNRLKNEPVKCECNCKDFAFCGPIISDVFGLCLDCGEFKRSDYCVKSSKGNINKSCGCISLFFGVLSVVCIATCASFLAFFFVSDSLSKDLSKLICIISGALIIPMCCLFQCLRFQYNFSRGKVDGNGNRTSSEFEWDDSSETLLKEPFNTPNSIV
jgi:hypothetical protein